MILSINRRSRHERRYFICLKTLVDEKTFLRKGKVKAGTYAGDLLSNLYKAIFRLSLELKSDYTNYYAIEYGSFAKYLHKRFLLPEEAVLTVDAQFANSSQIIFYRPGYYFLHEEYGLEFLKKLLEPRRTR